MNNKVLVKLIVLEIDESFDVMIPVNEVVWKVKEMMVKSINSLLGINMAINSSYVLINKTTARIYKNSEIIYNTDIRNATELILVNVKM